MNLGEPLRTIKKPLHFVQWLFLLCSRRAIRSITFAHFVRSVVPLLSLSLLLPSAANEELRMKNEKYLLADEKRISLYMLNKKQLYL
jgi:hypothetical protein